MKPTIRCLALFSLLFISHVHAADIVPNEIQMPGTQPGEVGNFESPDKCDNCHAGYNDLAPEHEPATGWRGAAVSAATALVAGMAAALLPPTVPAWRLQMTMASTAIPATP